MSALALSSDVFCDQSGVPHSECIACQDRSVTTLTVRQPWASLLATGIKDVENRSWSTKHRGRLAIHAAVNVDRDGMRQHAGLIARLQDEGRLPDPLPLGAIVGFVNVDDVVDDSPSVWAEANSLHWCVSDARQLADPVPMKGRLGLWKYTPDNDTDSPTSSSRAQPVVTEAQIHRVERHLRMRGCQPLSRDLIRDIALERPVMAPYWKSYEIAVRLAAKVLEVEPRFDEAPDRQGDQR